MSNKVYDIITNKLIEELENGTVPWKKSWIGGLPVNYVSRKPYSGINLFLLPGGGEYLTWNQIQKLGGKVKKGCHSYKVIFFKVYEPKDQDNDDDHRVPVLRYYNVFSLQDVEGIESKLVKYENDPIKTAEDLIGKYKEVLVESRDSARAFYSPTLDFINVPDKTCFPEIEEYYCTRFHEMVHSTGHKSRLNRFEDGAGTAMFGSESYSFEELVAEIGASMLCGVAGIENITLKNSASYIAGWLKVLKGDNKIVVRAASKAQAAVDYIRGINIPESQEVA